MRFVIQRVQNAAVTVEGAVAGAIGEGFLIFIGICDSDTEALADKMLKKALNLRIFQDEHGKTNRSLQDVGGELLLVSQFTLYADCRKGNRPSFVRAGNAAHAQQLYEYILEHAPQYCTNVQSGVFGADMSVSLVNSGPFTVVLDSDELFPVS